MSEVLEIEREFRVPVARLYRAFTDPAWLVRWWGPEGTTVFACDVDLRMGGAWHLGIELGSGERRTVRGELVEITADKLVFTWQWHYQHDQGLQTEVTLYFRALGDTRSHLTLRQQRFAEPAFQQVHSEGWLSSFNKLDAFLKETSR